MKVKAVRSKDTIVVVYQSKTLNIQKSQKPEEFAELENLMKAGDEEGIIKKFTSIAEEVEKFSKGIFSVDVENREVYFQGDRTTPMPKSLISKLKDHYQKKVDVTPLVLFWKKCLTNPSESSRKELFDFMLKNNIPLTSQGDILVEKGVSQKAGKLVDCHTGTVDNSVGMTVKMERGNVDDNRGNTCSHGLHVAAPDYVRNWWTSDIIVTCSVNPGDVVSVPEDYKSTKMRVCEYKVVGYADKCNIDPDQLVFNMEDIFDVEEAIVTAKRNEKSESVNPNNDKVTSEVDLSEKGLSSLTAKGIKAVIREIYGVEITLQDKNKKGILKKALGIVSKEPAQAEESVDSTDLANKTKAQLVEILEQKGQQVKGWKKIKKDDLIQKVLAC
jgi:hypothetical protein